MIYYIDQCMHVPSVKNENSIRRGAAPLTPIMIALPHSSKFLITCPSSHHIDLVVGEVQQYGNDAIRSHCQVNYMHPIRVDTSIQFQEIYIKHDMTDPSSKKTDLELSPLELSIVQGQIQGSEPAACRHGEPASCLLTRSWVLHCSSAF